MSQFLDEQWLRVIPESTLIDDVNATNITTVIGSLLFCSTLYTLSVLISPNIVPKYSMLGKYDRITWHTKVVASCFAVGAVSIVPFVSTNWDLWSSVSATTKLGIAHLYYAAACIGFDCLVRFYYWSYYKAEPLMIVHHLAFIATLIICRYFGLSAFSLSLCLLEEITIPLNSLSWMFNKTNRRMERAAVWTQTAVTALWAVCRNTWDLFITGYIMYHFKDMLAMAPFWFAGYTLAMNLLLFYLNNIWFRKAYYICKKLWRLQNMRERSGSDQSSNNTTKRATSQQVETDDVRHKTVRRYEHMRSRIGSSQSPVMVSTDNAN